MLEPRTIGLMKSPRGVKVFSMPQFAYEHGLTGQSRIQYKIRKSLKVQNNYFIGPVAINWMLVSNDPWAVQQVALAKEDQNYCIMYNMEGKRKWNANTKNKVTNFKNVITYTFR